jgi:replicative DNA helicase
MHSIEIEQALIGGVMMKNELFGAVSDMVEPGDFFEPLHQQLWEICANLIGAGKPASPMSVRQFLPPDAKVGEMPIQQYLARLAAEGGYTAEVPSLAATVRDYADQRAIAEVAKELSKTGARDPADLAAWGIEHLDGIVAARTTTGVPSLTLDQSVARAIDAAAQAYARDGAISGLTTGLRDLDRKLLGLQRGELIILAGRPGSGKTATALGIARNVARAGYRGIFYSLEMGDVALSQRMVTDEAYDFAQVAYSWLRSGRFNEKQFVAIRDAGLRLQGLPIRIEQQPKITIGQLAARSRQEKRRRGLDFFVVDYLGLMESSARYKGNRTNEIGELTAGLRALAKELDCAALVLSQLSRGVEGREDKRPNMGDLRDSGNIEQDADVIIMVYREAYYLERKEPPPGSAEHVVWQDAMQKNFNKLLLIVEKQRMGPIGAVEVFCDIASNAIRDAGYVRDEFINEPEMQF